MLISTVKLSKWKTPGGQLAPKEATIRMDYFNDGETVSLPES